MLSKTFIAASAFLATAAAGKSKTCPKDGPLSCHTSGSVDKCCTLSPGSILQTQFWDYDPSTGPSDSWTLHGLWVDFCGGQDYPETCRSMEGSDDISGTLKAFGANDTLAYMERYWKDYEGDDESFWQHEVEKHGSSRMSTLEPDCYTNYEPAQDLVDYFQKAVQMFKSLPSYDWLSAAGIKPSESETYSLQEIQSALSKHHGEEVFVGCDGENLNELWYYYNVRGSLQTGKFISAPSTSESTCPDDGIKYNPKSGSSGSNRVFVA